MDSSNWSQKDQESLAQIEAMLNAGNLDPGQLKSLKKQRRAMRNRASATASRQRKKEYLQNLERHMSELSNSNTLLLTSVARMTEAEQAREKHNSLVSGRSRRSAPAASCRGASLVLSLSDLLCLILWSRCLAMPAAAITSPAAAEGRTAEGQRRDRKATEGMRRVPKGACGRECDRDC